MGELVIYAYLAIGSAIYAVVAYIHHVGKLPARLAIRFEMNQIAFMVACILIGPAILPFAIVEAWRDDSDD